MSKTPSQPGDWSDRSQALLRSARADHASTTADRERVRSALAARLAESSSVSSADADAGLGSLDQAGRASLVSALKVGLGVACLIAGMFAFMRVSEHSKQAAPAQPASLPPMAATSTADTSRLPAPNASDVAAGERLAPERMRANAGTPLGQSPIASATPAGAAMLKPRRPAGGHASSTNGSPRGLRAADAPAKPSALADANTQTEPVPAAHGTPRSPVDVSAQLTAAGANRTARSAVGDSAQLKRPAPSVAEPSASDAALEHSSDSTSKRPRPPNEAGAKDTSDARAELSFIARINAALQTSQLKEVLELCAEHERRWRHGTFVQERNGLRAIAACRARTDGASDVARSFLATYPTGPLAPRVRDACASQLTVTKSRTDQ